jgi:hypothetical protein
MLRPCAAILLSSNGYVCPKPTLNSASHSTFRSAYRAAACFDAGARDASFSEDSSKLPPAIEGVLDLPMPGRAV